MYYLVILIFLITSLYYLLQPKVELFTNICLSSGDDRLCVNPENIAKFTDAPVQDKSPSKKVPVAKGTTKQTNFKPSGLEPITLKIIESKRPVSVIENPKVLVYEQDTGPSLLHGKLRLPIPHSMQNIGKTDNDPVFGIDKNLQKTPGFFQKKAKLNGPNQTFLKDKLFQTKPEIPPQKKIYTKEIDTEKIYTIGDVNNEFLLTVNGKMVFGLKKRHPVKMVNKPLELFVNKGLHRDCTFTFQKLENNLYRIFTSDYLGILVNKNKSLFVVPNDQMNINKYGSNAIFKMRSNSCKNMKLYSIETKNGDSCLRLKDGGIWNSLIQNYTHVTEFPVSMVNYGSLNCKKDDCRLKLTEIANIKTRPKMETFKAIKVNLEPKEKPLDKLLRTMIAVLDHEKHD